MDEKMTISILKILGSTIFWYIFVILLLCFAGGDNPEFLYRGF